jgi:hypothetical protein
MAKNIQFPIEDSQIQDLEHAFPELDSDECARAIAIFATTQIIDLLAGRKRYMSLSHQYADWLEELNAKLLPDVEFTPRRLMNQLNFPPGTAAYIARILRDRQNTTLMTRTWRTLLARLKKVKAEHDQLPENKRGGVSNLWSVTLTKREYRQLEMLLDEWEAEQIEKAPEERQSINLPEISENRMDFIKIKYKMTEIEKIITLLENRNNKGA